MHPGSGQAKTVALLGLVFVSGLRTRDTLMGKNGYLVMSDGDFCGFTKSPDTNAFTLEREVVKFAKAF